MPLYTHGGRPASEPGVRLLDSLRIVTKGGRRDALAIHPNVAQRIRAYLEAAGHSEPGTTKLYDRRGYNPEKSASFFATY